MTIEEQVILKRREGIGYKKIARQLGISFIQCSDILIDHGMTEHVTMPSTEIVEQIRTMYVDQYIGTQVIAKKFGISQTRVRNIIRAIGITLRPTAYHADFMLHVNHTYFSMIDTEDKAYWFGFLMADGYNCKYKWCIEVTLQSVDHDHLVKLQQQLNATAYEIKHKDAWCNGKLYFADRITIYSKQISQDLERYGMVQNKSLVVAFPQDIQDHLIRHFIRGYFDGNGSISIRSCACHCGNLEFLRSLNEIVLTHVGVVGSVHLGTQSVGRSKNSHYLCFSNRLGVTLFLNWLYDDCSVYLQRKYDKFLEFINRPIGSNHDPKSRELLEKLQRKYCTPC